MPTLPAVLLSFIGSLFFAAFAGLSGAIGAAATVLPASRTVAEPAPDTTLRADRRGVCRDVVYTQRDGVDPRFLSLDVYPARTDGPAPVVVFLHGGGWSIGDKSAVQFKPSWANRNGWAFVSVNYRLSPAVMHPEHARDAAAAVAWVREHAGAFNADPDRIALIGHSAGAHLAAIVACDETLLGEVGMTTDQIAGVVLLDGAGYNLPRRMKTVPDNALGRLYTGAFGDDPDLWARASPTLQALPGDRLGALFCVHAGERAESRIEGTELVRAWREAGSDATLHHAPDKDHAGINRRLGVMGDPDTRAIGRFLEDVFADD